MDLRLNTISMTLLLVCVFYIFLSTEINGQPSEAHVRLSETVVTRPSASELANAMSRSNISRGIRVEDMQRFFVIGKYSNGFVELLTAYKTLSARPIVFSSHEIQTLISDYRKRPLDITTRMDVQFKLYRKIQEIQCTIYVALTTMLPLFQDHLKIMADQVYLMLDMLYRGKLPASGWLWQLHVKLSGLKNFKLQKQTFREQHLPGLIDTIDRLIRSCQANDYLPATVHVVWYQVLAMNLDKNKIADGKLLPVDDGRLLLETLETFSRTVFKPISGLGVDWGQTPDEFKRQMENIKQKYYSGQWTEQPYDYVGLQERFLDVMKIQLYGRIWVHLVFYQKKGSRDGCEHDSFLSTLNAVLRFAYIDDRVFNDVLDLLSQLYEPDDGKIKQITSIIAQELNRVLCNCTGSSDARAAIDYELIEENCKTTKPNIDLEINERRFAQFASDVHRRVDRLPLNVLLFYINGNKTTDFIFPNV